MLKTVEELPLVYCPSSPAWPGYALLGFPGCLKMSFGRSLRFSTGLIPWIPSTSAVRVPSSSENLTIENLRLMASRSTSFGKQSSG